MGSTAPPYDELTLLVDQLLTARAEGAEPDPAAISIAVRGLTALLAATAPGRSVEVRVPPYAAVQCVAGPRHTRGTPGATVEADPWAWLAVATGRLSWAEAVASGSVRTSGARADLSALMPLLD
ncbi:MAG TPA: sterol carrier family protein [Mycobacteriales bacterium]|nr:sterol carrier family protein [Mycobacteriales bacterium]